MKRDTLFVICRTSATVSCLLTPVSCLLTPDPIRIDKQMY